MEYIMLSSFQQIKTSGHSSKGNQLKWMWDGAWYKADHMGYEGLAEVLISSLLEKSNITEFVKYEPVWILYKDRKFWGCKSDNFLLDGEELVTIDHLYRQFTGRSLTKKLADYSEIKDRVAHLVNFVEEITGLKDFGTYLATGLTIDAFFLNEDRHTNNIAVIYNAKEDSFRLCPYFDHGLALLADTTIDFGLDLSVEGCLGKIEAKPFSRSFDEQLEAAEELYGTDVRFYFDMKDVERGLQQFQGVYDEKVLHRVSEVLREQRRKYQYLF